MSLVQQPPVPERKTTQFGSNNPFRNRASQIPPFSTTSPLVPASPTVPTTPRPVSRNPFLDVFGDDGDLELPSRAIHKSNSFDASSTQRPVLTGAAADLFENLIITDHDRESKPRLNQGSTGVSRDIMKPPIPPNQLPSFKGRTPPPLPSSHRYSKSSDGRPPGMLGPVDKQKPPQPTNRVPPSNRAPQQRPRRNSDSSIMDTHELDREKAKDRERRERKAREAREARTTKDKDGRRPSKGTSSRSKKGTPLDMIDKLDVTGIYGSGLFHHDGPFDACNPHRNKNNQRAPMEAFPKDSANQSLTGFGPMPEKGDHSMLYGNRNAEAYHDFSRSAGRRGSSDDILRKPSKAMSFDPVARVEPVHGDETLGLGSSTFLDGAPASKKAILQQIEETQQAEALGERGSGLGRKKSLSHKIRGLSGGRPRFNTDNSYRRRESDEGIPSDTRFPSNSSTHPRRRNENNPFFSDYDAAYDRKGEFIDAGYVASRDRAPSSPRAPPAILPPSSEGGGRLMNRVRSLSKSKKRTDAP